MCCSFNGTFFVLTFSVILYLQNYSRDMFLFLYFLLIIVAAMTSFKVHQDKSSFTGKSILYLNRHQTEEWKGWMQVSFLGKKKLRLLFHIFMGYLILVGFCLCITLIYHKSELCKEGINAFSIKHLLSYCWFPFVHNTNLSELRTQNYAKRI